MSGQESIPAWALPAQSQQQAANAAPAQPAYPPSYYNTQNQYGMQPSPYPQPNQYSQPVQYPQQSYSGWDQYSSQASPMPQNNQQGVQPASAPVPTYPNTPTPVMMNQPQPTTAYPPQNTQLQPFSTSSTASAPHPTMARSSSMPVSPTALNADSKRNLSAGLTINSRDEEYEDGRVCNAEAVSKIRDAWIYTQLRMRAPEFTQYKQARIFLGTWNVNAKGKDEPLHSWLCADWGPNLENAPDIIAVGLQEMVDLNAVNVAVDNRSAQKSQQWVERIQATLDQRIRGYRLVCEQKYLVGLMICVFVRDIHLPRVRCVFSDAVGVGVMGMLGNKGGVSIRMQFYDSTICIVNSHLAAHRENVKGRNSDFGNILQKLNFKIGPDAVRDEIRNASLSHWLLGNSSVGTLDHDMTFWMGDLNYRIVEAIDTDMIITLCQNGTIDKLRPLDQLNIEREAGRVFQGFEEGQLTFPPTYKYQPGTDLYEQRPEKKIRAPAWCDRVLWYAQDPKYAKQIAYKRSELNISDHKPVMSTFAITFKDIVQHQRKAVLVEVMNVLSRYENKNPPNISLDTLEVNFSDVRYNDTVTKQLKIRNIGNAVAMFRFVPKPDETTICHSWMSIYPTYGMIVPGENDVVINITLTITNDLAQSLNDGTAVLNDDIILRLENGRDFYIKVRGSYARSCFGMALDELVLYSQPIRNVPIDPIKRFESAVDVSSVLCIPKELWRMVDALYEQGLQCPDLFFRGGVAEEVNDIRECLDTGAPFKKFQVESMADALMTFLTNLSANVIPLYLFPTTEINAENIQAYARRILEEIPPSHYNVFVYLLSFFRECLQFRSKNHLSPMKLAEICVNTLILGNTNQSDPDSTREKGMLLLMIHFLETSSI